MLNPIEKFKVAILHIKRLQIDSDRSSIAVCTGKCINVLHLVLDTSVSLIVDQYTAGYFRPFLHNKPAFHNLSMIYRIKPLPYNLNHLKIVWQLLDSIYYWWIMESRFIIEKLNGCVVKTLFQPLGWGPKYWWNSLFWILTGKGEGVIYEQNLWWKL